MKYVQALIRFGPYSSYIGDECPVPGDTVSVFVSYSHADALLVGPVVKLLRVNKSLVFQDTEQISPGKKWRDEIAKALAQSKLVIVFWCEHASSSQEVSSEWQAAIEQDKDLLPLLLDETPLPEPLAQFQWIDFRGAVGKSHTAVEAARPSPTTRLPTSPLMFLLPVAISIGLLAVVVAVAIVRQRLLFSLLLVLGIGIALLMHQLRGRRAYEILSPPLANPTQIAIAERLEAEIVHRVLRRGA